MEESLSEVLREYIGRSGLSYSRIASQAGLPNRSTISNWVNDYARRPRDWRDLVKVGIALDLSEAEIDRVLASARHQSIVALKAEVSDEADQALLAHWQAEAISEPSPPSRINVEVEDEIELHNHAPSPVIEPITVSTETAVQAVQIEAIEPILPAVQSTNKPTATTNTIRLTPLVWLLGALLLGSLGYFALRLLPRQTVPAAVTIATQAISESALASPSSAVLSTAVPTQLDSTIIKPTLLPTTLPTLAPAAQPTDLPSSPTPSPTATTPPTATATATATPTAVPTATPTLVPTPTPTPLTINTATNRLVQRHVNGRGTIRAILYGPEPTRQGLVIAVLSSTGLYLHDARHPEDVLAFVPLDSEPISAAFSPDGMRLAIGNRSSIITLYSIEALLAGNSTPLNTFIEPDSTQIRGLAWSPDGALVAAAYRDRRIALWDVAADELHGYLVGHTSQVFRVAFDTTGRVLASASFDQTVRLWDVEQMAELWTSDDLGTRIEAVTFSPDSTRLAAVGFAGHLLTWDVNDTTAPQPLLDIRDAHEQKAVLSVRYIDANRMMTTGQDNTARVWQADTGTLLETIAADAVRSADFTPFDTRLAIGSADGTLRILREEDGRFVLKSEQVLYTPRIYDLALWRQAEQLRLAAAISDGGIMVCDVVQANSDWMIDLCERPFMHQSRVDNIAVAPDGSQLASVTCDGQLTIWEIASRRIVQAIERPSERTTCSRHDRSQVTFSADGSVLIWLDWPTGTVAVYAAAEARTAENGQWQPRWTLAAENPDTPYTTFALSTEKAANILAVAGACNSAELWDSVSGQRLATLTFTPENVSESCQPITTLRFSPQNDLLAVGTANGGIALIDLVSNQQRCWAKEAESSTRINQIDFSADGALLVGAYNDTHLRLWNRDCTLRFDQSRAHTSHIYTAVFTPSDRALVSGSFDGTIHIWVSNP